MFNINIIWCETQKNPTYLTKSCSYKNLHFWPLEENGALMGVPIYYTNQMHQFEKFCVIYCVWITIRQQHEIDSWLRLEWYQDNSDLNEYLIAFYLSTPTTSLLPQTNPTLAYYNNNNNNNNNKLYLERVNTYVKPYYGLVSESTIIFPRALTFK